MDFTRQSPRAAEAHLTFLVRGEKTRIDCHKGVAHELPDTTGGARWRNWLAVAPCPSCAARRAEAPLVSP